jgi:hypothetical protein
MTSHSQHYDSLKNTWDRILISDVHGGWSSFENHYEIKRLNDEMILTGSNDSILSRVGKDMLNRFFESLTNDKGISKDPLKIFKRDSVWLISNAKELWLSFLRNENEPPEVDSLAINTIKDYQKIKNIVWSIQGSAWTDDYPMVSVSIIKNTDTLTLFSFGQYPFMLPWNVNGANVFNIGISTALAEMLPKKARSNKLRLSGVQFDDYLISKIFDAYIEEHSDYVRVRNKYPRQFLTIEKQYKISKASLRDMGSIEWGGLISGNCLDITLSKKYLPRNISFSVILGRRIILHSVKPIMKKGDKLIDRLSQNPIYKYTIETPNSLGEIHFVNRKSLSREAKRNFISDVKDRGIKVSTFRGRFRHAIFYELSENRGEAKSFSRWIILRDGANILWEIRGNFLMNLHPDIAKENGYVCRIVPNNEWRK